MSYQIWQTCYRLSSVVFPVSTILLFFAPRGTEESALLALAAVASAGIWAYCSGRRPRLGIAVRPGSEKRAGEADGENA